MAREDIVTGLKNAVERGYSIDTAVSSFINAGYKKEEVEEAVVSLGNVSAIAPSKTIIQKIPAILTPIQGAPAEISQQAIGAVQQRPKKSRKGIILVVVLSIILLALVGVLAYLIFFKKLFGQ